MLPGLRTVTLEGNRVASISDKPGDPGAIDLGGMTLMSGLITCHFHPPHHGPRRNCRGGRKAVIRDGQVVIDRLPPQGAKLAA